jgi:tRNA (guanine37-N1)-methyltransferase
MEISILTLFPEMFQGPLTHSIIKRAIEKKIVKINYVNIRDFGLGKHKIVDDTPYGGGQGMVLRVDVVEKAIESIRKKDLNSKEQRIILMDPHGKTFNQKKAKSLSRIKHLILICGHYEGIDERIDKFIDEKISIGDFITTGGEIPAMLIADSIIRLIKGVIKENSSKYESFSPYLEYPQYTKPRTYKNSDVPKILISGNHKKIQEWQLEQSIEITKKIRPDLLKKR